LGAVVVVVVVVLPLWVDLCGVQEVFEVHGVLENVVVVVVEDGVNY
jgi:hypothetical protein